jgi:hypothetical protein
MSNPVFGWKDVVNFAKNCFTCQRLKETTERKMEVTVKIKAN